VEKGGAPGVCVCVCVNTGAVVIDALTYKEKVMLNCQCFHVEVVSVMKQIVIINLNELLQISTFWQKVRRVD